MEKNKNRLYMTKRKSAGKFRRMDEQSLLIIQWYRLHVLVHVYVYRNWNKIDN